MARTIAQQTPPEQTPDTETQLADFFKQAERMAARLVAMIGAKRTTHEFIEDQDLTELAPDIADFLQGDDAMSLEESVRIDNIVNAKLTKEEWHLRDRAESAQNGHAVSCLEAGILIGVELERARRLHDLPNDRDGR